MGCQQLYHCRHGIILRHSNHRFNQWPIHALGCGDVYFDDGYNTGVDLSDPKNAVGDETIVAVLDDEGNVIYETDDNGLLVLDEQGTSPFV